MASQSAQNFLFQPETFTSKRLNRVIKFWLTADRLNRLYEFDSAFSISRNAFDLPFVLHAAIDATQNDKQTFQQKEGVFVPFIILLFYYVRSARPKPNVETKSSKNEKKFSKIQIHTQFALTHWHTYSFSAARNAKIFHFVFVIRFCTTLT